MKSFIQLKSWIYAVLLVVVSPMLILASPGQYYELTTLQQARENNADTMNMDQLGVVSGVSLPGVGLALLGFGLVGALIGDAVMGEDPDVRDYSRDPGSLLSRWGLGVSGAIGGYLAGRELQQLIRRPASTTEVYLDLTTNIIVEDTVLGILEDEEFFPSNARGRQKLEYFSVIPSRFINGYLVVLYSGRNRPGVAPPPLQEIRLLHYGNNSWHLAKASDASVLGLFGIRITSQTIQVSEESSRTVYSLEIPEAAEVSLILKSLMGQEAEALTVTNFQEFNNSLGWMGFTFTSTDRETPLFLHQSGTVIQVDLDEEDLPEGPVIVWAGEAGRIEGNYSQGIPDGEFRHAQSNGDLTVANFVNGLREIDELSPIIEVYDNLKEAWTDVQGLLQRGITLEAAEDLLMKWGQNLEQVPADPIDALLEAAQLNPNQGVYVTENGDRWELLQYSRIEVRNQAGQVESLSSRAVFSFLNDQGLGFYLTEEEIFLRENPIRSALYLSGSAGGTLYAAPRFVGFFGSAGLSTRFLYPFQRFPGIEGGREWAFDARNANLFSFNSSTIYTEKPYTTEGTGLNQVLVHQGWNSASSTNGAWSIALGAGVSRLNFAPFDQENLTQAGTGFTVGLDLQLSGVLGVGVNPVQVLPRFAFDTYRYNPNTTRYRAQTIEVRFFPFPLNLGIQYGFSLF